MRSRIHTSWPRQLASQDHHHPHRTPVVSRALPALPVPPHYSPVAKEQGPDAHREHAVACKRSGATFSAPRVSGKWCLSTDSPPHLHKGPVLPQPLPQDSLQLSCCARQSGLAHFLGGTGQQGHRRAPGSRTVLLNMWAVTPLGSKQPFTGVTYHMPCNQIFTLYFATVAKLVMK